MKKLKIYIEWNSIFREDKYLCSIELSNFSILKTKQNRHIINVICGLMKKYNNSKNEK